jgi:hypothetical protein
VQPCGTAGTVKRSRARRLRCLSRPATSRSASEPKFLVGNAWSTYASAVGRRVAEPARHVGFGCADGAGAGGAVEGAWCRLARGFASGGTAVGGADLDLRAPRFGRGGRGGIGAGSAFLGRGHPHDCRDRGRREQHQDGSRQPHPRGPATHE